MKSHLITTQCMSVWWAGKLYLTSHFLSLSCTDYLLPSSSYSLILVFVILSCRTAMCNEDGEWSPRVITDCLGMLHKLRISYKFSVCSIILVFVLFFYDRHTSYITITFLSVMALLLLLWDLWELCWMTDLQVHATSCLLFDNAKTTVVLC